MRYDSLSLELGTIVHGLQAVEESHILYPERPGPLENVLEESQASGRDPIMAQCHT